MKLVTLQISLLTPSVREHLGRRFDLAQDRARAQETHVEDRLIGFDLTQLVGALADAVLRPFRHRRMGVILVQGRDVIKDIVLVDEHAVQASVDDHRDFIGVSRIVGYAVGDGGRQNVAVTVLMLQAFAIEGSATGGAPDQEPARPHVARSPGEIADALEAEHRIVDVEGNIGTLEVEYDVPAAMKDAIAPGSLIPS